ncbi:hypothetical protein V1525DRAFT_404113 [Lipomyces kononenkoae]|uniref:Uncharacterized protein n=1 Tax=Lipomyces kononenkoae TaxID=34357 RepID=A0ACC3T0G0_LIPKO
MRVDIATVLLIATIHGAWADSGAVYTPELKLQIKSLTSEYTNDVELTYNPYKQTAKVLESEVAGKSIGTSDLVIVNEQVLSDRIPTSGGAKDVYSLHLTPSGKVWHIDYTYKLMAASGDLKSADVNVLLPNRGPVAVLKAPVTGTQQPQDENKSFIQKYWMFIVPMLIVFLLGSGGGGGGQ